MLVHRAHDEQNTSGRARGHGDVTVGAMTYVARTSAPPSIYWDHERSCREGGRGAGERSCWDEENGERGRAYVDGVRTREVVHCGGTSARGNH